MFAKHYCAPCHGHDIISYNKKQEMTMGTQHLHKFKRGFFEPIVFLMGFQKPQFECHCNGESRP